VTRRDKFIAMYRLTLSNFFIFGAQCRLLTPGRTHATEDRSVILNFLFVCCWVYFTTLCQLQRIFSIRLDDYVWSIRKGLGRNQICILKAVLRNFIGGTEENYEKSQLGELIAQTNIQYGDLLNMKQKLTSELQR
jgi:hypothetical protein